VQPAIHFKDVVKRYKNQNAVDSLSFDVEMGSVVALLGPNGAGKTTSISMMLGLRRPTSGTVRLLGQDPSLPANRKHIGAMLQQVGLPPIMNVEQLINQFRSYYPHPLETKKLLDIADLTKEARQQAVKLSGGQKRRLQFALAMAGDPRVLFLDEPTTAMDVTSRRGFWAQLRDFAATDGRTIVLTTHHLEEADSISDRIILVQHGKKIADGTPADLKRLTGNRYVSFVAGPDVNDEMLRALPHAEQVEWSGRHVRVRTKHSDDLLRALIARNYDVREFEVTSGALEDAFISLTGTSAEEAV
jgi:ABC-2 type transport system ATP-binding protein